MHTNIFLSIAVGLLFSTCGNKNKLEEESTDTKPLVTNNGETLSFSDKATFSLFKTEKVNSEPIQATFKAIGTVGAIVVPSGADASRNLVLFDDAELANHFTQLNQRQIHILQIQNINLKQKQTELERTKDLQQHGSATEQDLLDAQTALSIEESNLANEKVALTAHETQLKSSGFDSELLQQATAGTTYILVDIPENQISKLQKGQTCTIRYTAFPDEKFKGKIEAVADRVNHHTRMVKVRVSTHHPSGKIKAGMFADVSFGLSESHSITIHKTSVITVQGKSYVFVKRISENRLENSNSPQRSEILAFERREIQTGQQIGDRVLVFDGLHNEEEIAIEGVMQLKGLSFGY